MDANELFEERLPALLAASPDSLKLNAIYTFCVTGEGGGTWTVDLKNEPAVCRRGPQAGAECILEVSHADLRRMLANTDQARQLFYNNRIKVQGSIMLAAQVPKLLDLANASAPPEGLSALVAPLTAREFLERHWPARRLVAHPDPRRLEGLMGIPELQDMPALLNAWPSTVRLSDDHKGALVRPEAAIELFHCGCGMTVGPMEKAFPAIQAWLTKLQWDLCLPANVFGRSIVYASPRNSGTSGHFDQNANFVVHLRGKKRWRIAPNLHVENPTEQHILGHEPHPALAAYCIGELPDEMPDDAEVVEMAPGSVLFVPRGYWHETLALEDSMQLNFTFNQPTWADVLLPSIQSRLIRLARWRELADGAGPSDPARRKAAEDKLAGLLDHLTEDLQGLDPREMISELRPAEDATPFLNLKRAWDGKVAEERG